MSSRGYWINFPFIRTNLLEIAGNVFTTEESTSGFRSSRGVYTNETLYMGYSKKSLARFSTNTLHFATSGRRLNHGEFWEGAWRSFERLCTTQQSCWRGTDVVRGSNKKTPCPIPVSLVREVSVWWPVSNRLLWG